MERSWKFVAALRARCRRADNSGRRQFQF